LEKKKRKRRIPVAFVQLDPNYDSHISVVELQNWYYEHIAVYKVPIVKSIKELPLTATGKVKKEELKKQLNLV